MVTNSSIPAPVLNIRHNAICYHRFRESRASRTLGVGWIPGKFNLEYLLTKTTITRNMRHRIIESIFNNKAALIR